MLNSSALIQSAPYSGISVRYWSGIYSFVATPSGSNTDIYDGASKLGVTLMFGGRLLVATNDAPNAIPKQKK